MMSESDSDEEMQPKRKKGRVNSDKYKGNIIKQSRLAGKAYVNHVNRDGKGNSVPQVPTQKAYTEGKIPINEKKLDDIKKVQHYIPEEYKEFWDSIVEWPTKSSDDTEED